MSFEGTSQDSRDPNSPQWGYLKVKDPDTKLQYPAKDEKWNEYVMFVYDTNKECQQIDRRKNVDFVMVPAKLTIDRKTLNDLIEKARASKNIDNNLINKLQEAEKALQEDIMIPSGDIKIEREAQGSTVDSILWVALVTNVLEEDGCVK